MLLIPLTILGFFKTYFNQIPTFEEHITTYIHIHAIIASIWILMLIAQPLLIRYRKNKLHKQVGKISYLVFPLLILSFIPQMLTIFYSNNPNFLFFPLADSISLTLCYSLAIYHRKHPSKHMRYMVGTAIVFLGPTIGRIGPLILGLSESFTQHAQYSLIYLILVGLILLDKKYRKNYQPYLIILATWVIHQVSFNLVF